MPKRYVLDAAAVLRLLDDEPGAERVAEVLDRASISSVSLAVVAAELTRRGASPADVTSLLRDLHLDVVPFGLEQAVEAGTFGMRAAEWESGIEHWAWMALTYNLGATGFHR